MQFGSNLSYLYDSKSRPTTARSMALFASSGLCASATRDILIGGKTLLDKLKPNAARNAVGQMKIGKRGMVERAGQYLG
jgi:hypothetical protein